MDSRINKLPVLAVRGLEKRGLYGDGAHGGAGQAHHLRPVRAGLHLRPSRQLEEPQAYQTMENTLSTFGNPVIGALPVAAVDTDLVVKVLSPHALTHLPDKVEAAYRRGDLREKRMELMQACLDYCHQKTA